jgi:beta-lactamase class A
MKNLETTTYTFDRRTFLTGIGLSLSAAAIAGYGSHEMPSPQVTLTTGEEKFAPPLVPPAPEKVDVRLELEQAWHEIIRTRSGRIDVALFDSATGQTSRASSPDAGKFKTASIIKLAILEKLLMDEPDWVRDNASYIRPMITVSDNGVAQNLWVRINRNGNEMQEFFKLIGAGETEAGPGGNLFSTMTNATDQLMVVNNVAYAAHMRPEDAAFAKDLLHQVVPGQRWGVTGGVPGDVTVELKNGWVDERRHSIGHVSGQGVDYTIAVLTDDGPGAGEDMKTIELLSAKAWQIMRSAV